MLTVDRHSDQQAAALCAGLSPRGETWGATERTPSSSCSHTTLFGLPSGNQPTMIVISRWKGSECVCVCVRVCVRVVLYVSGCVHVKGWIYVRVCVWGGLWVSVCKGMGGVGEGWKGVYVCEGIGWCDKVGRCECNGFPSDWCDLLLLCRDFYGLTDEFPSNQLLYRSEQGAKRSLYFVSKAIRQLVNCNEGRVRVSVALWTAAFLFRWFEGQCVNCIVQLRNCWDFKLNNDSHINMQ